MRINNQLPDWNLNYQVAAFGAYATILVESIYLILGGFENASLLSISILTNGSAILLAGFGGPSSTALAILRICLTSLFLLFAIILRENETFDGTYAILCSVAHLVYQLRLQHNGDDSEESLPQHEICAKTDEAPSASGLQTPLEDYSGAAKFSGNIRIFFGNTFCLEGAMVSVAILGTVMTYRVFDFDLGFGLVFAFMSAFLSTIILFFLNYTRLRGRQMDSKKAFLTLIALMLVIGAPCFVFFATVEIPDIEFSWWRITFGIAWFMFLFKTTYVVCRYLVHATLFSCEACSQREAGIHGPSTQETSACCIWNDYVALPAIDQHIDQHVDNASKEFATFRIKRQKGPDLVERFWLNDQEWFQISPRSFVIFLVSCIALASFGGDASNLGGSFAGIGSHFLKNTAFYLTMVFTFVCTGHTPAEDSPELMFVPIKYALPGWKPTARAMITTMLVHVYLVFPAFSDVNLGIVVPVACTLMAPLLLAGISKPLDSTAQHGKLEADPEEKDLDGSLDEPPLSTTRAWTVDSTLVLSSPRIGSLDLRVFLLGFSVTLYDIVCNKYQDEMLVTRWPTSAVVSISVTAVWLFLEVMLPKHRDVDPGTLSLVTTALVGIYSHVNFLDAFGLYDDELEDGNITHTMPVPDSARHSKPILIALWYATLLSMVVANRRLVHQKADVALLTKNGPPREDHLLFGFYVKSSQINLAWQLRNSRVAIFLLFVMLASCMDDNWPLEMNATVAGTLLFALIVGFRLQPRRDNSDEERSSAHVAALGFSAFMAILAIGLSRHGVLNGIVSDPKSHWKAGSWSALVSHQLFLSISLRLEGRGSFTRLMHRGETLTSGLLDEEEVTAQEEKPGIYDESLSD